jgi:hypothetical protein
MGVDSRMLAQGAKGRALPFQVLKDGAAQVGTVADIEQIEQGGNGDLMVVGVGAFGEKEQPLEQMLDP